ncbi:MAG TPA: hypothetical protein VGM11_11815, partial [Acidobacteriaceae bacterium]
MFPSSLARPALLVAVLLATLPAIAQSSAPTFTLTTSNVSLSTNGTGSIPYTLTAVNGYIGTIILRCQAPTVAAGVNIPYCGGGPVVSSTLNPKDTNYPVYTGSFPLYGNGVIVPSGIAVSRNPVVAIFFIVALLSGLSLRRKTARRLTLPLFFAVLGALCCTTGCGSASQGFTPGTYKYVVSATQSPVPLYL